MKSFTASDFGYCTTGAAAYTSMPIASIMDTALLAVSIVIIPLICLLGT